MLVKVGNKTVALVSTKGKTKEQIFDEMRAEAIRMGLLKTGRELSSIVTAGSPRMRICFAPLRHLVTGPRIAEPPGHARLT